MWNLSKLESWIRFLIHESRITYTVTTSSLSWHLLIFNNLTIWSKNDANIMLDIGKFTIFVVELFDHIFSRLARWGHTQSLFGHFISWYIQLVFQHFFSINPKTPKPYTYDRYAWGFWGHSFWQELQVLHLLWSNRLDPKRSVSFATFYIKGFFAFFRFQLKILRNWLFRSLP